MAEAAPVVGPRNNPARPTWRVTTATRIFVLAVAVGQALSMERLQTALPTLLALIALAAVTCAVEFDVPSSVSRWIPLSEGLISVVLIATVAPFVTPLLIYLAVPPVVAGIRHGAVSATNTSLVMGSGLFVSSVAAPSVGAAPPPLPFSVPWLVLGWGIGLLAAWQTRAVRSVEEANKPYLAAHRLLAQLRTVSPDLVDGLDPTTAAQRLAESVTAVSGIGDVTVMAGSPGRPLSPLATSSTSEDARAEAFRIARECCDTQRAVHAHDVLALPLRVADHQFGAVVLRPRNRTQATALEDLQDIVDEHALRLDTSLLFDEIRTRATTEERHRLARDIHDGVAQEVASLGYLLDELAGSSSDPAARETAKQLRLQVTRMVKELRLSVFDLRQDLPEDRPLAEALTEYVSRVTGDAGIRSHLHLEEKHNTLPASVRSELLRISQEAITNVRRHACASNLWVTLAIDGSEARLRVEDDGTGTVGQRDMHFGLRTMKERADRIKAEFAVQERPGGGTIVSVVARAAQFSPATSGGSRDVYRRSAC